LNHVSLSNARMMAELWVRKGPSEKAISGAFYGVRAELATACELSEQLLRMAQRERHPALLVEAHHALGQYLFFQGDIAHHGCRDVGRWSIRPVELGLPWRNPRFAWGLNHP